MHNEFQKKIKNEDLEKIYSIKDAVSSRDNFYSQHSEDTIATRQGLRVYQYAYDNDEQLKANILMRAGLVASDNYSILIDSDDPNDLEIKNFIDWNFREFYQGLWRQDLYRIHANTQIFGFTISEQVYKPIEVGEWRGNIGLSRLLLRPPYDFRLKLDNMEEVGFLIQKQIGGNIQLPVWKFFIYANGINFNNLYGMSEIRQCFKNIKTKSQLTTYIGMLNERVFAPYLVVKVPPATSPQRRESIVETLGTMVGSDGLVMNNNETLDLIQIDKPKEASESILLGISQCNTAINRCFMLPDLMGFSDSSTGSESLGRVQLELYFKNVINYEQGKLEEAIFERIIRPLVNINYGEREIYPKIKFSTDLTAFIQDKWNLYLQGKASDLVFKQPDDAVMFREDLDLPIQEKEVEKQGLDNEKSNKTQEIEKAKDVELSQDNLDKHVIYLATQANFKKDISNSKKIFDRLEQEFGAILNDIATADKEYAITNLLRKNIVGENDIKAIAEFTLPKKNTKSMEKAFLKYYTKARTEGEEDFSTVYGQQLERTQAEFHLPKKSITKISLKNGLAALAIFRGEREAIAFLNSRSLFLAGVQNNDILDAVKTIMSNGLLYGESEDEIIGNIDRYFRDYGVDKLTGIKYKPKGSITTIVRTNISAAYNYGRKLSYSKPGVIESIEGVQYSAIIDDNTTEFCSTQDGRQYRVDDPELNFILPPNHFNCRSLLIPIFIGEPFTASKNLAIRPAVGFGG